MPGRTLLSLKIITPEGILFTKSDLQTVIVPLADGTPIGIRPGHTPLLAETTQGMIKYRTLEGQDTLDLFAGVLDIRDNEVVILTAGEKSEVTSEFTEDIEQEYDRLMQTLIKQLIIQGK